MPTIANQAPPPDSLRGRSLALLNELRGGRLTDDEAFPIRLMGDLIRSAWSSLVEAELSAGAPVDVQLLVPLTLTLRRQDEPPLTRGDAVLPPLVSLLGRPWVERVETGGGMVCTPAWSHAEARRLAQPRPYGGGFPPPAWWVRPAGGGAARLTLMLPPRLATLETVVATVLPARLDVDADGQPLSEWVSCPLLTGSRWEAVRSYVLQKHGPLIAPGAQWLDQKNDGAPNPPPQP